jgi:hypothetical protein
VGVKGGWHVKLTISPPYVSQLSRKCGILDILQSYWLPWSVTGIALLFLAILETHIIIIGSLLMLILLLGLCNMWMWSMALPFQEYTPYTAFIFRVKGKRVSQC